MKGEEVREILTQNGYKLSDIAQKMEVTPQSLHKYLLSDDIKTGVLERISKAIDKDITFFFIKDDNKWDELKLVNDMINREKMIYFLYQRIVDITVLNSQYFKISTYNVSQAAEIMNHFTFPIIEFVNKENEKGELISRDLVKTDGIGSWEKFSLDKKKLYNAELEESVRILQDMFFERFKLLYNKIRGY
jgi:transcriptional regulator with XRE-family HTH domain